MTEIAYALYAIGFILLAGVAVVYVKRNPKLSAELQAEFNKIHTASASMMDHLHMIHTVASAPVSVAIIPTVAPVVPNDAVTDALPALKAALAAGDPIAVEWLRRRVKYGDDLWAVQAGENVSLTMSDMAPAKAAGFTKTDAFAAHWAAGRPVEPASTYDFNQANVTPDDHGKNFHVGPGAFTRTLTIPEGYTGGVRCYIDKINDKEDDAITILVDGVLATPPSPNFPIGEFATIRGAGEHTISGAASNNTFVWQMQLVD